MNDDLALFVSNVYKSASTDTDDDMHYYTIQFKPTRMTKWNPLYHPKLMSTKDVYISCALYGHTAVGRGKKQDVRMVTALWADIDAGTTHQKPSLSSWHDVCDLAYDLKTQGLAPSMVVRTSEGGHFWWMLENPITSIQHAERALKSMQAKCRQITGGIGVDYTHDVTRVLRPPSSINSKTGYVATLEDISTFNTYSMTGLPVADMPDTETAERASADTLKTISASSVRVGYQFLDNMSNYGFENYRVALMWKENQIPPKITDTSPSGITMSLMSRVWAMIVESCDIGTVRVLTVSSGMAYRQKWGHKQQPLEWYARTLDAIERTRGI